MIPPELQIRPSYLARRCLLVLHLAAASTALLLPLFWSIAGLLFVWAHLVWLRRSQPLPDYLRILPDGRVAVMRADTAPLVADILPSSLITSWVIALHLHTTTGRLHLLLWADCADRDVLRQWRVWLRWSLPAQQRRLREQG